MKTFNLPDLGEGLAEAEIREWYVKEGDIVKTEQPLCSVETAKAVVDVPSPHAGKIVKLYGKVGDIIKTGQPLVAYEEQATEERKDAGTVVGRVEVGDKILKESPMGITKTTATTSRIKVTPAIRALARELNIDLTQITPSGPDGSITLKDIKQSSNLSSPEVTFAEPLHGTRRYMVQFMAQTHREVVPVTIMDYADIEHWSEKEDLTLRVIQAMIAGCKTEPTLNSHFNGKSLTRQLYSEINIGLAVDTKDGLYVPVLKDVQKNKKLREQIEKFKESARKHAFAPEDLKDATIVLSNFGSIAGRYANPMLVPPSVAILGVGRTDNTVISKNGKLTAHRILPLSLTFDHRAVTGGEAARFLAATIKELEKSKK